MASGGAAEEKFSDETFDLLCTICKHEGRNVEAVKYCTGCCDYYCSKCIKKFHDIVPALKRHRVIDKGQFKNKSGMELPMVPTESCVRHGHKPTDMYCVNHDTVGCPTCMTIEHKSCTDIVYVPEYVQNGKRKTNLKDIQNTLDSVEKTLSESIGVFKQAKQKTMKKQAESIKNIRQFRQDINKRLDELENASVAATEQKYAEMINKIEEAMRLITESKRDVDSAQDKLRAAGNNVSQAFVSEKIARTVAAKAIECLTEQRHEDQNEEIRFAPDRKLTDLLNGLKGLGQVLNQDSQDIAKRQDGLLQTRGMKKYPINDASDLKDCDINSSCVLKDGTVFLPDRINKRLIRLDMSNYNVRDQFILPVKPWQVCVISNEEVAVSYRQKEILFISLGT